MSLQSSHPQKVVTLDEETTRPIDAGGPSQTYLPHHAVTDEAAAKTTFALNHMTVARLGYAAVLDLAAELDCVGVEVRNELPQPLFDGLDSTAAGDLARARGLRLLVVAEVKRFNHWSGAKAIEALDLMKIAQAAGAEAVSLIPRNDNLGGATASVRRRCGWR